MYKAVKIRNHKIHYRVKEWQGEKYISGWLEYIGKECFTHAQGNSFITHKDYIAYDSPSVVPKYVENKIYSLCNREKLIDNNK